MTDGSVIDFRKAARASFNIETGIRFFRLVLSTVLYNYIRLMVFLWRSLWKAENRNPIRKLVICGFGGIGNHLMFTPALTQLKDGIPDLEIHFVATNTASADIVRCHPAVKSISISNLTTVAGFKTLINAGRYIRKLQPDAVISASGLNPVTGSIIARLSRARVTIGEDWKGRGFFYTSKINANTHRYEAIQNNRLVQKIWPGIDLHSVKLNLLLPEKVTAEAGEWFDTLKLSTQKAIIGIHPGSGREQQWKRWPLENFVRLSRRLAEQHGFTSIFFVGPDEKNLKEALLELNVSPKHICTGSGSILKTAARIGLCRLFISNDSGLRQIAVALAVPTFGLFGPTSMKKNHYSNNIHRAVYRRNVLCQPCHYTKWWLACKMERPCLNSLSIEKVFREISSALP